ncbi:MAG: aminoglycoside phosphotransferase family protein [Actinomycetota bacterium]
MIHKGLRWLEDSEEGREWLERLPRLVEECAFRWRLDLGEPFAYAFASLALPATRADGSSAVLKVQFPDRESEHEAAALLRWAGEGAIRLLAFDPRRHALLLERCEPGTPLSKAGPDAALDAAIALLPRLWKPAAAPFRSLAKEAAWWSKGLERTWEATGAPFEHSLLEAALDAISALSGTQGEQVLVHQDLHAGNILRAQREPWLVIDPKPLVGEREFSIVALVRGRELGSGLDQVRDRLDRLTGALGLDRERARRWALAQTVAWSLDDDGADADQVECARWLAEA